MHGLSQVFCFPAAVIPGAACSWPGMKSPKNKWDLAHLQSRSAPKRRRSLELGVFVTLGPSVFTKRSGGWTAGDVGGGCVGTCDVQETASVGQEVLPPRGGGRKRSKQVLWTFEETFSLKTTVKRLSQILSSDIDIPTGRRP